MNTILLVDDDRYAIDGLLKHVPWEDMGIRVVGTAEDGVRALELFRERKPDIVITDIYMPEMDGFQLTEAIHETDPEFPVVILSGFDDYANARKAVTKGVQHFLLKPPSVSEIEFVVREVVQQLNESKERDHLLANYVRQQEIVQRSMREMFFRDLLSTRYREEELPRQRIAFMELPAETAVQVLTLSLIRTEGRTRTGERDWQLLRFGTGNIIREVLGKRLENEDGLSAEVIEYSDKDFVVIFMGAPPSRESLEAVIPEASAAVVDHILQYMKISVLGGLGSLRNGYPHILDSFLESQAAIETAEMNDWNRIYSYRERTVPAEERILPLEAIRKLHDAIFRKQLQDAADLWQRLKDDPALVSASLPALKGVCAGVLSAWWTSVRSTPEPLHPPASVAGEQSADAGLEALLVSLNRCRSGRQLLDWMDDQMSRAMTQIRENLQGKKSHALIDRVIHDYIEKCYHREITLEEIAASIHVNRNYLSQLFKKITGEPFVTYFNKYRIEKAKELLSTGKYMVYEISEMVGFRNSTYFSQVFKSIAGISPSEYKR
ncbi:response regulator [Paenibacillaceae bacterium WGS1546]|uniref:response regulator transcription factor n=1 Tax=Cohnella sp. WGS1546 TaxID=3366810 RepID=UPI00372D1347